MKKKAKKDSLKKRKSDHINLALESRINEELIDDRFYYEPFLSAHPSENPWKPFSFAGKQMNYPVWVSSMTGGTKEAGEINKNLAKMCGEYGFGMGLGSCRILLESDKRFADFDLRKYIGDDYPFYANLGIAQVERMLKDQSTDKIVEMVDKLQADGLIVHVNPLQEFFQPEGDHIQNRPIDIIAELIELTNLRIIVKEVGQGFGPESIRALMKLPIQTIEYAASGGTNFALMEMKRAKDISNEMWAKVGHSALEMNDMVNKAIEEGTPDGRCTEFIISGGISHSLDGYYLVEKNKGTAVFGQASSFLKPARESLEATIDYARSITENLALAKSFLRVR